MGKLIFETESYNTIGACIEVYKELGIGLHESIYHESLILELTERKIPFATEPQLQVYYKQHLLSKTLRPDFIVYDQIIVEIKSVKQLADEHRSQILNYLKVTRKPLGFLVNFSSPKKVEIERYINTKDNPQQSLMDLPSLMQK